VHKKEAKLLPPDAFLSRNVQKHLVSSMPISIERSFQYWWVSRLETPVTNICIQRSDLLPTPCRQLERSVPSTSLCGNCWHCSERMLLRELQTDEVETHIRVATFILCCHVISPSLLLS